MDLDVQSDSKLMLNLNHGDNNIRQPQPKHTRLRRFMSIGSRSRAGTLPNKLHAKADIDATTPMQTLSPRPDGSQSRLRTQPKRSISNFLLRTSTDVSKSVKDGASVHTVKGHSPTTELCSTKLAPAAMQGQKVYHQGQEHLPLSGDPYQSVQMQSRKHSPLKPLYDLPIAASRSAALTSHPVRKKDIGIEDEWPTQQEFCGRQKG
ncbi:hypothetical protein SVAN01_08822 [Stagonosporopsis vannaccii]|nr:hypothetical protein SVAN01_08822 [Stagonosporopsis vannaccii]